jgi:hypothetical protein
MLYQSFHCTFPVISHRQSLILAIYIAVLTILTWVVQRLMLAVSEEANRVGVLPLI